MPLSRANGVDIWYEVTGDGPALVLIHANPFDHDLWMYQTAHFSTWFKVVGIDIRGYGRSAKVTTPFSLKDMCGDVVGVMQDLGIARAICGGCSVGSGIAILLGLDHPVRFDALILVGGNSGASGRYQARVEGYRSDLEGYHIKHLRDLVHPQFADSRLGRHLLNQFVEREPRLRGEAIAQERPSALRCQQSRIAKAKYYSASFSVAILLLQSRCYRQLQSFTSDKHNRF